MKTITQFKSIESFSTVRLSAYKINEKNIDNFITLHSNEEVMSTLGGLRTTQQSHENLDWNLKQWDENGFGLWMFYLKDSQIWVGRGGLRRVDVGGHEEIELGYALMPQFWNQGLATEISKACLEIAFEIIGLENIVSFTLVTNKASQRVMDKLGFQYERDIIHTGLPHVLYRMKIPRKVELLPYDRKWPELYKQESQIIQHVLGNHLREIYHIGSTSIPNMLSKPVIDIMLACENLDSIDTITEQLRGINYHNIRRQIIPHRSFIAIKQDEQIRYHLHIHERGSSQIKRHVDFRLCY
ncbi:MAG: GNAT family N-acetyltransferase [Tatlockia sp.]|nr:GNAT family N-acetyltransferase [Tatlockia sp.]